MNKKRAFVSIAILFMSVFLWAQSGTAYMIEDETLVKAFHKTSSYNGTGGSSGKDYSKWVDVVGNDSVYNTFGIDITIDTSYLYFDIYTNFPESGDGWIKPADLFFSVYGFDYGVVLTDHGDRKQGEFYYDIDYRTSYDVFKGVRGWIYAGWYDEPDQMIPVLVKDGYLLDNNVSVSWTSVENNPNWRIDIDVPLFSDLREEQIFPEDLDISQIDVIFGTATCGNDVIAGSPEPVPEPATMLLFGTGLIGLVGIGRKKFKRKLTVHG